MAVSEPFSNTATPKTGLLSIRSAYPHRYIKHKCFAEDAPEMAPIGLKGELVGRSVKCWWGEEGVWFNGQLDRFDDETSSYVVR